MNEDSISLIAMAVLTITFFLAALPLKNYLEINKVRKKEKKWIDWLRDKPSKEQYCHLHNQRLESITCDYCGATRQYPSLQMVMINEPKFGLINNSFNKYLYFKTYICPGCNAELYRESYIE